MNLYDNWYWLDGRDVVPATSMSDLKNNHRQIAQDIVGGKLVSTVFLGLNHRHDEGPPLVFETMVFPGEQAGLELYCERYSTYDAAETGHATAVRWAQRHGRMDQRVKRFGARAVAAAKAARSELRGAGS